MAERAGVSPTVAARELQVLRDRGLAVYEARIVATDRARTQTAWVANLHAWPESLLVAVNRVVLLAPRKKPVKPATRVPARFGHLFWNANIAKLNLETDGSYIAGRMLRAPDVGAWVWALDHLSGDAIDTALSRRGMPESIRAMVGNRRKYA